MGTFRHLAISVLAFLCVADAYACGDKLVVLGGGVDFEHLKRSKHPGSIIVKASPNSALSASNAQTELVGSLETAGHKVRVVTSENELTDALKSSGADLILVDAGEASVVAAEFGKASP